MSENGQAAKSGSLLGGLLATRDPSRPTVFGRVYAPDEAWLARLPDEEILDPELAIIDTHHHLWDLPGFRYLLPEFVADLQCGHKLVATVFNECHAMYRAGGPPEMRPVGEVEFCAGMAAMSDSGQYGSTRINAGIVGFADLRLGDRVAAVLEAQLMAGGGRFKGVRHAAGWDADPAIGNSHSSPGPGLYRDAAFRQGLKRLFSYGLSFDAWVFFPQLADAVDLARSFPDEPIVMCHMGGALGYGAYANRRDEVFAAWKAGMAELARCENVTVKLGGAMVRLAAFDYGREPQPVSSERLAALWGPYVTTCIELFGPRRCMVESNFPVEKVGVSYRTLWNGFKRMTAELSGAEKRSVFSETARRVYRLPAE
ncbi:MAG: amidohydrolase family protein [Rubrivivax sp.]